MIIKHISHDKNACISDICSTVGIINFSVYADISFKNNTDKKIVAVKFNARGYNVLEENVPVNNSPIFEIMIENLNIDAFSEAVPTRILLPDNHITKIEISEVQTYFSDGSSNLYNGKNITEYELLSFDINNQDDAKIVSALSSFSTQIKNYPIEVGNDWVCCCETFNSGNVCRRCKKNKIDVFLTVNLSNALKTVEKFDTLNFE